MSISDKFYVRCNNLGYWDSSADFKNFSQLNSIYGNWEGSSKLYHLQHPTLKALNSNNPQINEDLRIFRHIPSTNLPTEAYKNDTYGINFIYDPIATDSQPLLSNRLFKYASLPDAYQEVDYIESNGTQYIDSGCRPNNNWSVEVTAALLNTGSARDGCLLGSRNDGNTQFIVWMNNVNGTSAPSIIPRIGANNGILYSPLNYGVPITTYMCKTFSLVNGVRYDSGTTSTFTESSNLLIFALVSGGSVDSRTFYGRVYKCKLWNDSNNLVRDFIPCIQKSSGKAGLYDRVNGTFYTDVNGNNFTIGAATPIDYPIMNPYMANIMSDFSYTPTKVQIGAGTYNIGHSGNSTFKNAGVFAICGGGGGSGGVENNGDDCAGGGGGGGGYAVVYYRIRNTDAAKSATMQLAITVGGGGGAGGNTWHGGGGGYSRLNFIINGTHALYITAYGGGGGQSDTGGGASYVNGGSGGGVSYQKSGVETYVAYGGAGGTSSTGVGQGGTAWPGTIYDTNQLYVAILFASAGSGGGRADDTGGSPMGQGGQGKPANSHSMPYTSWSNTLKSISYGATYGGGVGADVNDAQAGGGGASQLANGGNGGAERTTGNPGGWPGGGAGGGAAGSNEDRQGSAGASGVCYYYR